MKGVSAMRIKAFVQLSVLTAAAILATCGLAHAQEDYQVLKRFAPSEGGLPTRMVRAGDGNFYGAISGPGGGVFRLTPAGAYTMIESPDIPMVFFNPILGTNGDLYIGARDTNPFPTQTLFRIALDGTTTTVHQGSQYGALVEGDDGHFYGITSGDGAFAMGTVFRLSPTGVFTTLRSLTPAEGPRYGYLTRGTDGHFYGATGYGVGGAGSLFRMDTDGVTTTLHAFGDGPEGAGPSAGLVQASDGNFYGTTASGGANSAGTVFRLQLNGTITVLHAFSSPADQFIGGQQLIQGSDGALYGTLWRGIYSVTLNGQFRLLHFANTAAAVKRWGYGIAGLVEGPDAGLYGTARYVYDVHSGLGPGVLFRLNLQRSACTNVIDLRQGIVTGAIKSELPAFIFALVVQPTMVNLLWQGVTPAITPTAAFEFSIPWGDSDVVGLYSLVVTADGHVCEAWTTPAAKTP
jgi:uncharacterized repeat protein (TIGR03803 family)